jgi:hypothetical protein
MKEEVESVRISRIYSMCKGEEGGILEACQCRKLRLVTLRFGDLGSDNALYRHYTPRTDARFDGLLVPD